MNLRTKLAAALLKIGDVPYAVAKGMTADELIALYEFDHFIRKSEGGPDEFWNLTPRLIAEHRRKTVIDLKEIAKNKRIRRKHEQHLERMRLRGVVEDTNIE